MSELAISLTVSEDERLEQAEALVRGYCGWHIAPSREDEVYVLERDALVITLPSLYVTAVAVADVDEVAYVATEDYTATTSGVIRRTSGYWPLGTTVTFTHGYDEPPAEVTAIVQAIAQRAVSNPGGASSRSIGPFSESYGSSATGTALSLLESEKDTLRRYRIPVVS